MTAASVASPSMNACVFSVFPFSSVGDWVLGTLFSETTGPERDCVLRVRRSNLRSVLFPPLQSCQEDATHSTDTCSSQQHCNAQRRRQRL